MNITKADIVNRISTNVGISKTEAKTVVEEVLATVVDTLSEGKKIELRGFGVFNIKHRSARAARNPKTGEIIDLAEKFVPMFKPSSDFVTKVATKLARNTNNTKKTAAKTKPVSKKATAKAVATKATAKAVAKPSAKTSKNKK